MDQAYELALAKEGTGDAAYAEDQWVAWEEALALAPDLAAKKRLVHGAFGATTPDFAFRAALCTLLEVQELLDAGTSEGDAAADALMQKEKEALLAGERELSGKGFWRKAKRVSHRRAVLELEIATRLTKSAMVITELSRAVAAAMGLTLSDPAPPVAEAEVVSQAPAKTALSDDEISTKTRVYNGLQLLQYYSDESTLKSMAQTQLENMQPYAREVFFAHVVQDKASWAKHLTATATGLFRGMFTKKTATQLPQVNLTSDQRWWIFELFLDKFMFETADIEGYLDVIYEDFKRTKVDGKAFGSREAHSRLSLPQLQALFDQDPAFFRDDAAFALMRVFLMQADFKIDQESVLDVRDEQTRAMKFAELQGYLKALTPFSACANTVRAWILHEQLRNLQYHESAGELLPKLIQYISLPRFGSEVTNAAYIGSVKAEELVVFEDPGYKYRHSDYTQPTTPLRVDRLSVELGDRQVKAKDDVNLIKAILSRLWTSGRLTDDDEATIRKYLSAEFVDAHKAECMVVSGCGDLSVWKPKLPRKGDELSEWSSTTEISFCESSPSFFSPEDAMEIFVNVRNVKTLTVQVYEVRTVDYYTRMRSEVQGDICLDGLLPNEEQLIDLSHLSPWHKARIPVKVSPTSTGRRGVFVVEVFEKDTSCRAILRKGHLRHVERVTSRGIEFSVLNERGEIVRDAELLLMNLKSGTSKAQPPRRFSPVDSSGAIVVPFRQAGESATDKFGIIFEHEGFGYLTRGFDYTEATFSLNAQMFIDHEQLRPGEDASLFVRPILSVGSTMTHVIPADMLTDIKVTVKFSSVNRESSAAVGQKTVQEFASIDELMGGRCSFTIPLDAEGVSVDIGARVRAPSASETVDVGSLPSVSSSKSFDVQRVAKFEDTFSPHFLRRLDHTSAAPTPQYEYYIVVLGHNGECIKGKAMTITVKHTHFETLPSFDLESDERGEINLGKLEFIEEISACFSGSYSGPNSWKWELPNLRTYTPQMVNCSTGENARIPLPMAFSSCIEEWVETHLISLYRIGDLSTDADSPTLEPVGPEAALSCVKNSNGQGVGVSFQLGHAGNYVLYVRPLDVRYPVTVCKLKRALPSVGSSGLLVEKKKILLATPTRPLMILGYDVEQSSNSQTRLIVKLDEAKPSSTKVWVLLKQSLDRPDAKLTSVVKTRGLGSGRGNHSLGSLAFESSRMENEYLKKRKISDEYTYILQRRAFVNANPSSVLLLGASSLPRPTLIQTPHVLDESDMEALVMRAGEKVSGFKKAEDQTIRNNRALFARESRHIGGLTREAPGSSISFLSKSSVMIACSSLDEHGVARVLLSDIPLYADAEHQNLELVILAFDADDGQVTSLETQLKATHQEHFVQKRDVRLATEEALHNDQPAMQLQRHEVLSAGQSRTLPRSFSSKYALYENIQSAMDLWATLCTDQQLPGFVEQLKDWANMKQKAKIAFYMKNACDDLNFFIYRKDRPFFEDHVKPYVHAKLSPSMIDLYVLEDVAAIAQRYAQPAAFQKLSIIEKVLVAERADSIATKEAMCQHLIDVVEGACLADSAVGHQLSRIFDTVLSQGAVKPVPTSEGECFGGDDVKDCDISESYTAYAPDTSARPAPPPGGFAFGSASSSAAFGSVRREPTQMRQQQQQSFAYAPTSPAYSPTSPAYTPTSGSPRMFASMAMPAPVTLMSKKKTISRVDESSDPSDSSDEDSDDDDDNDSDFGVQSLDSDDDAEDDTQEDQGEGDPDKRARKTEATKRWAKPYVLAGKVRRVQEKRFFSSQKPQLDGRNLFWRDYAKHVMQQASTSSNEQPQFLSSHFPEALRSFTEGILALSLLDFAAGEAAPTSIRTLPGGHRVQLDAAADVVLYHQGIGSGSVAKEPNSVLVVKQRLVAHSEFSSASSRDFVDIRPAHEFLVNRIYTCVVSVSNIGSARLKNVNLLRQIPRGSIPVTSNSFYTKNEVIEIAPHDTQMYTYNFYFPEVGRFTQYPAHASLDGEVIAWASTDEHYTNPIVVVPKPTAVDLTSWSDVAARGTLQDAITFMNGKLSLASLNLNALAWRCQDKAFYTGLVGYLRTRWVFVDSIWKYAFLHNDMVGIHEMTSSNNDFLRSLGAGIRTGAVQLGEIYYQERFDSAFSFDHTEFGPLLSRRVHRVAGKVASSSFGLFGPTEVTVAAGEEPARVLHKKAREYYRTLCHVLSSQSTLTANHLLVVTYFLIIFQRTADAMTLFERVKALESSEMRDTNEFSIVADYIDSYLDFFRPHTSEDATTRFAVARRNVAKYNKLANDRWRLRFPRLQEVLDEFDDLQAAAKQRGHATTATGTTDSSAKQAIQRVPDDQEVRLQAVVKGGEIHFASQHLGACEISFYRIDVELMFSTEPFDSFSGSAASKSSLLLIQPWRQMLVSLADGTSTASNPLVTKSVRIPADLAASPMLLRIREVESTRTVSSVAAPIDLTRSYFNSQLQVVVTKQAGLVQVLHNGLPVPSCYVKVYVKASDSATSARGVKTHFYKDGYTDVVGRFDYASLNGDLLTRVEKFSLLVSHPTLGTTVEQVAPPVLAVTSSEFKDREALEALWY